MIRKQKYTTLRSSNDCRLASADITLRFVVTLPEHASPESLSEEQFTRWQTAAKRVALHEQTHVDIHIENAHALERKLTTVALGNFASCESLGEPLDHEYDFSRENDTREQDIFRIRLAIRS
jgi:predicted secreted Zn-dependent protease